MCTRTYFQSVLFKYFSRQISIHKIFKISTIFNFRIIIIVGFGDRGVGSKTDTLQTRGLGVSEMYLAFLIYYIIL